MGDVEAHGLGPSHASLTSPESCFCFIFTSQSGVAMGDSVISSGYMKGLD